MEKATFLEACSVLMTHEQRVRALNNYLREEDAKNGDGIFQGLPSTDIKIRRLAIRLLAIGSGCQPLNSVVEYFFDECMDMPGGGSLTYPDGTKFDLATPEDLWAVVCHERDLMATASSLPAE